MRLFIAVDFDQDVNAALQKTVGQAKSAGVTGNFTRDANFHMTLAFLGEQRDPEAAIDALKQLAFEPFEIEMEGVNHCKDLYYVNVQDSKDLEETARIVRVALEENGIYFDPKPFKPHITLVRKANLPEDYAFSFKKMTCPIKAIHLYRSETIKNVLTYTNIFTLHAQ